MSKSPLFSRLQRTLWLADEAVSRGMSAGEVLERRDEAVDQGRRRLLQGLGVAALATAGCSASTSGEDSPVGVATDEIKSTRVVIVGAGLAGLACARRLEKHGFAPRVYEAGRRVGGRTLTLRSPQFATKVELGGELIDTAHTDVMTLATEVGLTILDQAGAVGSLQAEKYFLGGSEYTEAQVLEDFIPVAKMMQKDFKSQGATKYATFDAFSPASRALDLMSIPAWLDAHGVGGRLKKLLEIAYTSEYGREAEEQSFLNLLYFIEKKPPPFLLFGESDEKFTIKEGNDAIATRVASALGAPVNLGHVLVAVKAKANGTVDAIFEADGKTVTVTCDKLVLAIPFNQLRKCDLSKLPLSSAKKLAIDTVPYGTNAKLMIGTSSRPWIAGGFAGTSFTDHAFHESWDSSRGYPGPGGVMTDFSGGKIGLSMANGTVGQQATKFVAQLDKVFPGSAAAYTGKAVRMTWSTVPFFEGSYACWAPGNYTDFVGSEMLVEGNVHFCGEHTSLDYQGFMNGAVETGYRAAKEIKQAVAGGQALLDARTGPVRRTA